MTKKMCKVILHLRTQQKQYAGEDIAFSPKDFPNLKVDDVVEIYNPDDDYVRLVLKVSKGSFRDDFSQKDAISIEQSIASTFQLKSYSDVIVNQVVPFTVEIDSMELTFKDQYLGRSEMWRLKNSLVDTCVYLNKKIEYCSATIRCQVYEMWSHGEKVASGVVTAATKVVFRSSTSMVYLFIQMSSEMWEFDIYGDLYFEKAVNGFLSELFTKWKSNGSNHEVTIVLFSRIYYMATSLEHFPDNMRDCLQTDYKGRFYEDYYRVAIQNEKYEDWGNTLIHLRHLFVDYQSYLLNVHKKDNRGCKIPKAIISSAAQGNFLEVLNMSLNVFEKHYIDRSFDRTGQLSVVITPGVGVFEVDRELTNVTMQRIIDNGVGSDLVCVGEQPLHAVPLLKFHNKATFTNNVEDYSMPHWINLSFYSTNKKVGYSSYIPRIKLPTQSNGVNQWKGWDWKTPAQYHLQRGKPIGNDNSWPNSVYDFDDYDAKIFRLPSTQSIHRRSLQRKKTPSSEVDISKIFRRQNSEPEIHHPRTATADYLSLKSFNSGNERDSVPITLASSPAITIPAKKKVTASEHLYSSSFGALNIEVKPRIALNKDQWFQDDMWTQCNQRMFSPASSNHSGSPKDKKTVYSRQTEEVRRPCRALINPFDPSHAVIKLTSNRRRWTHIFPRGPTGLLIQQHHFQSTHSKLEIVHEGGNSASTRTIASSKRLRNSVARQSSDGNVSSRTPQTLLWGVTGEQEWTPALTTGVDWKSLTIPACLPITTDYFPDERSLQIDYLVSHYSVLPDDVNADYAQQRAVYRRPLTTKEVYLELVSQRLAQGFQLVIRSSEEKNEKALPKSPMNSSLIRSSSTIKDDEESEEHFLSIGRIFHRITLTGSTVTVTRYRPKHPYPSIKIHYRYRFQAPNNDKYEVSWADFTTEKLENYNWNYLDHYICTRGDRDFDLVETLKFWRFRMQLLPTFQVATKKILDGNDRCDVFVPLNADEISNLIDGFLKFIETCINRIRRPNNSSKKGARGSGNASQGSSLTNTGFRERVNSNRLGERPRARSGSKGLERWGAAKQDSSGSGRVSPADSGVESKSSPFQQTFSVDSNTPADNQNFSQTTEATEDACKEFKLSVQASNQTIIEAMCSQNTGFSFIKSADLPSWTFVSGDATAWLFGHMDKMTEVHAVEKFNEMIKQKLICHASGDSKHVFVNGFYLYYIISTDGVAPEMESLRPHGDLCMFRNEWMEVETTCERIRSEPSSPTNNVKPQPSAAAPIAATIPKSNAEENVMPEQPERSIPPYKDVYVDVDFGKKSDRQEWGHVRYQSKYKPCEAFEITVQWVQATGAVVTDLVQSWARKAQQCNLQLVPIPSNPFALPYSCKSDSLRGPIFIPLRIDCIMGTRSYLFEEFPDDTWDERMHLFQEAIVLKFGFMKKYEDPANLFGSAKSSAAAQKLPLQHHYVHSSGNMFALIPQAHQMIHKQQGILMKNSPGLPRYQESPVANSHEDYISRHVCEKSKESLLEDNRVGFLWSWNYMVSKRWKTSSTPAMGDDSFMMKVMRDFQDFCANSNNRLQEFWQSRSQHETPINSD